MQLKISELFNPIDVVLLTIIACWDHKETFSFPFFPSLLSCLVIKLFHSFLFHSFSTRASLSIFNSHNRWFSNFRFQLMLLILISANDSRFMSNSYAPNVHHEVRTTIKKICGSCEFSTKANKSKWKKKMFIKDLRKEKLWVSQ